ncbi:PEP/pyruvate-binding domain-containing protein [Rhizomonospora bruguierae]|uniref:PEP/pyruvate-binding domain-containing protein n=1 Tax=Rhizomonospora bruguierae TaxID=1581705 RepID=UPI001BCB3973|nr:PEP/pyruvate-binding domain-containing protein [Micromonospora sp. NBRC 107566]
MIVPLLTAAAESCGGKAGALGTLLRAGLPVPDGFVVPLDAYRAAAPDLGLETRAGQPDAARQAIDAHPLPADLLDALGRGLDALGDPPVAVRSSAANEDTAAASAAGQHESILAVHGASAVVRAVRACWASLHSRRAIDYRGVTGRDQPSGDPAMAVLIQRHVDADVSGVMFTPSGPSGVTTIEASWGLGPSVVGGTVTPDAYHIAADGSVTHTTGTKRTRLDRHGAHLVASDVPAARRHLPSIDDATAARLTRLGHDAAAVLGGAQDIEWAIADRRIWLLQARPVTAAPPPRSGSTVATAATLAGTPGSHGTATGTARIVRGPDDFTRVHPGDILVCPYTDPAWTPLLRVAAGIVTETGGVLSHAAIVAREYRIPAVLGIPTATTALHDGTTITIDGTAGTITTHA